MRRQTKVFETSGAVGESAYLRSPNRIPALRAPREQYNRHMVLHISAKSTGRGVIEDAIFYGKTLFQICVVIGFLQLYAFSADAPPADSSADQLAATVERMAEIGAALSPSFSPDGKQIAFVCRLSGVPQVWIVPTEGGEPHRVTTLDDPIERVTWSPTDEWLAFSLAPSGGMNQQIYLIRPDGNDLQRLTDGGTDNNWIGRWTRDGRYLMFGSNRTDPQAADAFIYEHGQRLRLIAKNTGIGWLTDFSRDRTKAVLWQMQNRSDSNLYLLNMAGDASGSANKTLLTPHNAPGSFSGGLFSPDGLSIYMSTNKDRDLGAFGRVVLGEDGKPGPIEILAERSNAELESFDLSRDGQTAALLWDVSGRNELCFLDLKTHALTNVPELPSGVATDVSFSPDGNRLALSLSSATQPRDVWCIDTKTGKPSQITHSPHPGINLTDLVEPELVAFKAHDGLDLSGWLYRPAGFQAPGSLVLSFHGGPEFQERPSFAPLYQALLAKGIAVFAPNVRGSSGFGKKFANLDNGPLRFNAIKDIESCVDTVVKLGVADPKRIGIVGGSYGGYMTMAGLTEYPDRFAAGASFVGVVDFETFFANTEPWMAAVSKVEYGDPDTQRDLLRSLSPIHKIDRVIAPTIVVHGAHDTNAPVEESQQIVDNLKKRGVPVEYVLIPDEGHDFRKTSNRNKAIVSMVNWFDRYLVPNNSDTAKK
jgi:dipeptidyl aminopeptidase/acylaminoacyl peptidase